MALIPMEYRGGWTQTTLSPQTGDEAVNNYGTLYALKNDDLQLVELVWTGNGTAPVANSYYFVLPSAYIPKVQCLTPLRNGVMLEARAEGKARVALSTDAWSGGTLTYVIAN